MDSVTIHGLPRIFAAKHCFPKIVWTVLFLSACTGLYFVISSRMEDFMERKVLIKMERNETIEMRFPTLTICDTDLNNDAQSGELNMFPSDCSEQRRNQTTSLFRYGCKLFMAGVSFSCSYGAASKCQFPKEFSPADNILKCFSINKNGTFIQSLPVRFGGIDVLLWKNSSLHTVQGITSKPLRNFHNGLQLQVHSPDQAWGYSQAKSIFLFPGYQFQVSLKKNVYKRLPAPFPSKCSNKSTVKQLINGSYSIENCKFSCVLNNMYAKCGGVPTQYQKLIRHERSFKPKAVNKSVLSRCIDEFYKIIGSLKCDCPIPCTEVVYEAVVSLKPWLQSSITKAMRAELAEYFGIPLSEVNLDLFKRNILHLNVFYQEFTTNNNIEEELYGLTSFFGDVGGLLGLLLGASVISFMEITWILAETIFRKCVTLNIKVTDTESLDNH